MAAFAKIDDGSSVEAAVLSESGSTATETGADDGQQSSEQPVWHQFSSNVNYRITTILDVNGGADPGADFDSFSSAGADNNNNPKCLTDGSSTTPTKTPGYGIPIDVLTLRDPSMGRWRQRVSYHSGTQVDYNDDVMGHKVVPHPFAGDDGSRLCEETAAINCG